MSILIKGMELPKSCVNCPIAFFDDEYTILHCPLTAEEFSKNSFIYKRSDKCPLVPVPAHGRLGDLDALITTFCEWGTSLESKGKFVITMAEAKQAIVDIIDSAPTIIPAEEGET